MASLTNNLIVITGWRTGFRVCGSFGMALGIIGAITMRNPPRDKVEKEFEDQESQFNQTKSMFREYLDGFILLFTNKSAVFVLIGASIRIF